MKKLRTSPVISTTASPVISTTASSVISTTAGRRNLDRARRGFSLPEMLIAVLLLGLVSIMATVMTSAVLSTTHLMQDISQAEILGNELLENVQGVLRVAYSVEIAETKSDNTCDLVLAIDENNTDYRFVIDEGKIILGQPIDDEKKVFDGDLLFSGVSYGGLKVDSLSFAADDAEDTVTVSVSVSRGGKTIWTGSIKVRPLSGVSEIKKNEETG